MAQHQTPADVKSRFEAPSSFFKVLTIEIDLWHTPA
jgi:hypothetical protein